MASQLVEILYKLKDQASAGLNKVTKATNNVEKSTGKLDKSVKKTGLSMKQFTKGLGVAGLLLVLKKTFTEFTKFESKMVDVGNLFGATGDQVKGMSDQVKNLSNEMPVATQDLAEGLFDVVSAGIEVGESMDFLAVSAKLAVAGVTDVKTAVDGLTSVINAYGLEANRAEDIANLFFEAQKLGKTTIAELSSTIGRLAPIAKAAGLSLEDMFASVSTLTTAGIKTDEAITSMRATLTAIIAPGDEAATVAKMLGFDFSVTALKAKGLVKFLQELKQKTGGNVEIMQKLVPQIRALQGVLALAGEQAENFARNQEDLTDRAGVLTAAYKTQAETVGAKWTVMLNNLKNLGLDVFEIISFPLNLIISSTSALFSVLSGSIFQREAQKMSNLSQKLAKENEFRQKKLLALQNKIKNKKKDTLLVDKEITEEQKNQLEKIKKTLAFIQGDDDDDDDEGKKDKKKEKLTAEQQALKDLESELFQEKKETEQQRLLELSDQEINSLKITEAQKEAIKARQRKIEKKNRKKIAKELFSVLELSAKNEENLIKSSSEFGLNILKKGATGGLKAEAAKQAAIAAGELVIPPLIPLGLARLAGAGIMFGGAAAIDSIKLADGGSMVVDQPTVIGNNVIAGEAGAERIDVTPIDESGQANVMNVTIVLEDGTELAKGVGTAIKQLEREGLLR
ncbi:MAG: phage tail tape measure protein [bacterium]|nr:phage tail tape measure protein [bacterium]